MKQNDGNLEWWQESFCKQNKGIVAHNYCSEARIRNLGVGTNANDGSILIATQTTDGLNLYSWNYDCSEWNSLVYNYEPSTDGDPTHFKKLQICSWPNNDVLYFVGGVGPSNEVITFSLNQPATVDLEIKQNYFIQTGICKQDKNGKKILNGIRWSENCSLGCLYASCIFTESPILLQKDPSWFYIGKDKASLKNEIVYGLACINAKGEFETNHKVFEGTAISFNNASVATITKQNSSEIFVVYYGIECEQFGVCKFVVTPNGEPKHALSLKIDDPNEISLYGTIVMEHCFAVGSTIYGLSSSYEDHERCLRLWSMDIATTKRKISPIMTAVDESPIGIMASTATSSEQSKYVIFGANDKVLTSIAVGLRRLPWEIERIIWIGYYKKT